MKRESWKSLLRPNLLNGKEKVPFHLAYHELLFQQELITFLFPVEQLDDLRKQLEKERDFKCEEAAKELNNVKLAVESSRHELEARQKKVEAQAAEVLFMHCDAYTDTSHLYVKILDIYLFLLISDFQVDGITLKINSVKESGAAKQQELISKGEEIMKEVHFH